jgi:hypothetical protein
MRGMHSCNNSFSPQRSRSRSNNSLWWMLHQLSTKYTLSSYTCRSCSYMLVMRIFEHETRGTLKQDNSNLRGTYSRRWIINVHFFLFLSFSLSFLFRCCLVRAWTHRSRSLECEFWNIKKLTHGDYGSCDKSTRQTWKSRTCHGSILFNPFSFECLRTLPHWSNFEAAYI